MSHERAMGRNGDLTDGGQTISRSELGKFDSDCANCATRRDLRRIGRRANFFWGKIADSLIGNGDFSENEAKGISKKQE